MQVVNFVLATWRKQINVSCATISTKNAVNVTALIGKVYAFIKSSNGIIQKQKRVESILAAKLLKDNL